MIGTKFGEYFTTKITEIKSKINNTVQNDDIINPLNNCPVKAFHQSFNSFRPLTTEVTKLTSLSPNK